MKHKKGVVLAYVLIFLLVLVVLGFALGSSGIFSLSRSFQIQNSTSALYAAQAGIADEIYDIEENQLAPVPQCPPSVGNNSYTLPNNILPNNTRISNQTILANYGSGCTSSAVINGMTIPPGMAYLSAEGSISTARKTVNELLQIYSWPFQGAGFGSSSVALSGNASTDSYESKACGGGMYGGSNISQDGNIGTNSSSNGAVDLSGNADIGGAVSVGPGGTAGSPTVSTSGSVNCPGSSCSGGVNILPAPFPMPVITDPYGGAGTTNVNLSGSTNYGVLTPGQYGSISLSGTSTLELTCGNYSINSLQMSGNGEITIDSSCSESNPVKLYVYNSLTISGNGFINNEEAPTLLIYGMPTLTTASISGNGNGGYALYAPNTNVTITGNGDLYGSIIGKTITNSGNAKIHYDTCLGIDAYTKLNLPIPKSWNSQ